MHIKQHIMQEAVNTHVDERHTVQTIERRTHKHIQYIIHINTSTWLDQLQPAPCERRQNRTILWKPRQHLISPRLFPPVFIQLSRMSGLQRWRRQRGATGNLYSGLDFSPKAKDTLTVCGILAFRQGNCLTCSCRIRLFSFFLFLLFLYTFQCNASCIIYNDSFLLSTVLCKQYR